MCIYCGSLDHSFSDDQIDSSEEFASANGASITLVSASSDQDINGLLSRVRWTSLNQTFGFPTSGTQYGSYSHQISSGGVIYTVDETTTFQAFNTTMQNAARSAFTMVNELTTLQFTENTASPGASTIRLGITNDAQPTAYAYYPASAVYGGDIWMGSQTSSSVMTNPVMGNYAWHAHIHELGHALGLKHGQETGGPANTAMTSAHDAMEYTVMTYRSYVGDPLSGGYSNETWGYAQSWMMYDIAALQYMYGADFGTRSGNTVYTFDPNTGQMFVDGAGQGTPGGNRIFRTVWDGNGTDTYNLSNYTAGLSINLAPGSHSVFSSAQIANLGDGRYAQGNLYNAVLYNGDRRSLIENAIGGSGNDQISGSQANNTLTGNGGNDYLLGLIGNDTLVGGAGSNNLDGSGGHDYATFSVTRSAATVTRNSNGTWTISGSGFSDTVRNVEIASFSDGTRVALQSLSRADVTGDGRSEVLWANAATGDVGYWQTIGGSAQWSYIGRGSTTMRAVASGDFDGDGSADILWQNPSNNYIGAWFMGSGAPSWQVVDIGSTTMRIAGVGDFNADGTTDILWQNPTNNYVGMWEMHNGQSTWREIATGSTTMNVAGVGDFNGDGTSDILWQNPTNNLVGLWAMNGSQMSWSLVGGGSTTVNLVGVGDFTGDGTTDVLWRNNSNGIVGYWEMHNGDETWRQIGGSTTSYNVSGIGDYNNDGTADIFWRNPTTGDTCVWSMSNGSATWQYLGGSTTSYNVIPT